jgi:hypothetical protein
MDASNLKTKTFFASTPSRGHQQTSHSLHLGKAYATVINIVGTNTNGKATSELQLSKSHVALFKMNNYNSQQMIPRLELLAAINTTPSYRI